MSSYETYLKIIEVHGDRVTMAQVIEDEFLGGGVLANGEAVRHPDDKNDPVVGSKLAVGRALQKLGRRLEREARAITAQADNDRAQRQASADKANLEELVELPAKPNKKRGPKLNKEKAQQIRDLWTAGHHFQDLAKNFGVSEKSITNIIQNKTYT